jgi:general secretion pathway protein G
MKLLPSPRLAALRTPRSLRTLRPLHPLQAAFTLLEIMLVVMIIALLAGSAIYLMRNNVDQARYARCDQDIENIKTQLQMYEVTNGTFPSTEQGLRALVEMPGGDPQPRRWRQLMQDVPLDPWGTPYILRYPASKSAKDPYDLFSAGKDKTPNTADDIGNW